MANIKLTGINSVSGQTVLINGAGNDTIELSSTGDTILQTGGVNGPASSGSLTIQSGPVGSGGGSGTAGTLIIRGGSGNSSGQVAAPLLVQGGFGLNGATPGDLTLSGGSISGGAASGPAGTTTLAGGAAFSGATTGGVTIVQGGDASSSALTGGALTLRAGNANTADSAGVDTTIQGGAATGNATGGDLILQTTTAGSTGATLQTQTTRMQITPTQVQVVNAQLLATSHDSFSTALPVPTVLAVSGTIDATSTGNTTLYTVPTGESVIVTGAYIRLSSVSGFTSVPTLGIGQNGAADDIFASVPITAIDTADELWGFSPGGSSIIAGSAAAIAIGIDTAAVATTYDIIVYLYGHII